MFIATGGVPNIDVLERGKDLIVSSWEILSGEAKPEERVLVFDDNGSHPAMQAAELLAEGGSSVEIVTPERYLGTGIGRAGIIPPTPRYSIATACASPSTHGFCRSSARATRCAQEALGSDHGSEHFERLIDQVVVKHGTLPADRSVPGVARAIAQSWRGGLHRVACRPGANSGPQPRRYVSSLPHRRCGCQPNIHAAIFDALRLAKDL